MSAHIKICASPHEVQMEEKAHTNYLSRCSKQRFANWRNVIKGRPEFIQRICNTRKNNKQINKKGKSTRALQRSNLNRQAGESHFADSLFVFCPFIGPRRNNRQDKDNIKPHLQYLSPRRVIKKPNVYTSHQYHEYQGNKIDSINRTELWRDMSETYLIIFMEFGIPAFAQVKNDAQPRNLMERSHRDRFELESKFHAHENKCPLW
ncbi:hypothetical protein CDAR_590241 [Caerostris darwini]|uniref:Uncharacterized protein n=1 Tax=Caerostris darwini TaxID=1538125 RepID=A0AAV4NRM8_9ARAC|nr:hypothetical protein CDAR_590241 [Caerostris darwini]